MKGFKMESLTIYRRIYIGFVVSIYSTGDKLKD